MLLRGFRFGMLLQIAVGPVCIFIFSTASKLGFLQAETGVIAVTLIDFLYIVAALAGIGNLMRNREGLQKGLKQFGACVVILFGINVILSALGWTILPNIPSVSHGEHTTVFLQTLLLTVSNPLTILFWAGVFSSKMSEENWSQNKMIYFGMGAVCSTLFFLTLIAFLGTLLHQFLPSLVMTVLNVMVGVILCGYGGKMIFDRKQIGTQNVEP